MARQNSQAASARPRRQPLGRRSKLVVRNQEDGYAYRWVNANLERDPNRVQDFQDQGWEVVPADKVSVGDKRVDSPSAPGSEATVSVGLGTKAVLMRIPKEFYEEDQRAKQAEINAMEKEMYRDAKKASDYGYVGPDRD
jgi:hypothetical protein